jgi:hypothetical protein
MRLSTERLSTERLARLAVPLLALLFVARGLADLSFMPLWDGQLYVDCLVGAAQAPGVATFSCYDHPTHAYVALLLGPWALAGYPGVLVANLLLGAAAVFAVARAARALAPGHASLPALAAALLSCHPLVLANALNLSPDFAVYAFFTLLLAALLERRRAWSVLWGSALVLSKESGMLIYPVLVGSYLVAFPLGGRPVREWPKAVLRHAHLAVPLVLAAAFMGWKLFLSPNRQLWGGHGGSGLVGILLSFRLSPVFRQYLALIFVLSFSWLLAVGGGLWVLGGALSRLRGGLARGGAAAVRAQGLVPGRSAAFLALLLAGGTLALTRFETFANPRYLLLLAPVLLLVGVFGWASVLRPRPALGTAVLAGVAALLLVSNYASVDPVSARRFGTFRVGERTLFAIGRRTDPCCGAGRDQLVYNTQFAEYHRLLDAAYADAFRAGRHVLLHPGADFDTLNRVDPATGRRTLLAGGAANPRLPYGPWEDEAFRAAHPSPVYLALGNLDDAAYLRELEAHFVVGAPRRYLARFGHAADVYPLAWKAPGGGGARRVAGSPAP